jgi:hypothetical protein
VFFLDSVLFQRSLSQIPESSFSLESTVLTFVGNIFTEQEFISSYFASVHPWLPFLNKRDFMERVLNPLGPIRPINTLLVALMKLVAITPESDPRSIEYYCIKANLLRATESSPFDIKMFQSILLLGLYELGHGIHPAAYMTIGSCLRYGNALGINMTVESDIQGVLNDSQSEEKRRSWWAVLLLDR